MLKKSRGTIALSEFQGGREERGTPAFHDDVGAEGMLSWGTKDIACGNLKKLDGDDAEEGITPIQTEMLFVRRRNRGVLGRSRQNTQMSVVQRKH